jgi:hypothetical protein
MNKIYAKAIAIINSCVTREHAVVAHNFVKLAHPHLSDSQSHTVNEAYLTMILKIMGVIE